MDWRIVASFREISTLQYMGSKARIVTQVTNAIKSLSPRRVIDLFAGTGSVGFSLKQSLEVISNDLELYAYIINEAILNGCHFTKDDYKVFSDTVNKQYSILKSRFSNLIHEEESYFNSDIPDWKEYKRFCEETPAVGYETHLPKYHTLNQLIEALKSGEQLPFNCLFSIYYANTYFGLSQCCEIDAIYTGIQFLEDIRCKNVMKAALMSAMSDNASTTTHFAQYLKVNSQRSCTSLITKRRRSIRLAFEQKITEFKELGLLSCKTPNSVCLNMDYLEALDALDKKSGTVVYADPPYFKEHYSRYYHVLNTLCLYDYPDVALNPQTNAPSAGRYRQERTASDFGKLKQALPAFEKLISKCHEKGFDLVISYSSNSIVSIENIVDAMEQYYSVSTSEVSLKHSNQGRALRGAEKVNEYILSGKCRG